MRWGKPAPIRRPPGFIEPCLPTLWQKPPEGDGWLHEIKHDGYRVIVRKADGSVRIFTRRGYDLADRFPRILDAVLALEPSSIVVDGEAVVCGEDGVSDFARLRVRAVNDEAFLYAFDVLELDGKDCRPEQLEHRKTELERILRKATPGIRYTEHLTSDAPAMFASACKMGLEGIVSKRRDSRYQSGRSNDWIKVKNPESPAMRRLQEE
jgi:bifunctional non-homologous end joining protein LigD